MIQKLIDAYELEREMYRKCIDTDEEIEKGRAKWDSGLWIRYKVFEDTITLAPRVDPMKHGHWVEQEHCDWVYSKEYRCSECGKYRLMTNPFGREWNYCPNCGAHMGVEDGMERK